MRLMKQCSLFSPRNMKVCADGLAAKLCRNVIREVQRESFWHAISREAGWASLWPLQAPYYQATCGDLHDRVFLLRFLRFTCQQSPPTIVQWWELNSAVWSGWGLDSCCCRPPRVYVWPHLTSHPPGFKQMRSRRPAAEEAVLTLGWN